ncbi:MAG: 3-hydroxyacyl-ACP dehydratase FabZ family protein [Pirellulaceae bacterium]
MSQKDIILPFSEFDMDRILVDRDGINEVNLQRFEMQQLDAIVVEDLDRLVCVGYKDATPDEFWVRGHMPGMPLMPGVIMCEAAAQLASYFATRHHLLGDGAIGLGGLEGVRFRNVVLPGNRLVLMSQMTKVRRGALIVCRFQGFVNEQIVVEGEIKGIPLPKTI